MSKLILALAIVFLSIGSQAASVFFELNGTRYAMSGFNYRFGLLTVTSPLPITCAFAPVQGNSPFVLDFNGFRTNYDPDSFNYSNTGNEVYVLRIDTEFDGSCTVADSVFHNGFEN